MQCPLQDKVKIEYPCKWEYRVITTHDVNINDEVFGVDFGAEYSISISHKNTKFVSYKISLVVVSDEHRVGIYDKLKQVKSIKYIL